MSDMHPSYDAGAATHGTMFLVFGVLMPASIGSARYLRRMPKTAPKRYWWAVHAFLNALILGLFICAWTVAVYISGRAQFTNAHKKLGLAILVILLFQFFYGAALSVLHAFVKPSMRKDGVLDWIHWGLGYSLLILGWVNVPMGIYRSADDYSVSKALTILYFIWFGFVVFVLAGIEGLYQYKGGNQVFANSDNELDKKVEQTPLQDRKASAEPMTRE